MRGTKALIMVTTLALILVLAAAPAWAEVVAQQAPAIELIIPPAAWPGTPVAIQGTNFGLLQVPGVSKVTFNGVDAGTALFWSDDYIIITVPENATSGPVVVTTLDGPSNAYEFTVYEEVPTFSCYFAEGTTRSGFEEWLTLYNPWDEDLVATVTYMIADAANRIRYYNVPAHTRVSVYVNAEIGSDHDVSVTVTSTARLVAERPMYFRYKGEWSGGHCTVPALEPSMTWYFAEGTTRAGFEEWLCLANPNNVDAAVQVTYLFPDGEAVVLPCVVPAMKRFTVDVNATVGPGRDVALKVESDQPVVAERPMYFSYNWMWDGGHITIGAPTTRTTWFFAEGTTRAGFDEWLCLSNPGDLDARVNIVYAFQDGGTQVQELTLVPGQRFSVAVRRVVGPDKDVSVTVESDQGLVVERSLYFTYHDAWDGGHNTIGCSP